MRGLCNKVSDPLKVRQRLACIAEDIVWTYIHISICNTGKNRDMSTAKCKIEFSKVLQGLCTVKSKNKSDTFTSTFSRNHCFNYFFKGRLQEVFLVKVIYTKKYTTCS